MHRFPNDSSIRRMRLAALLFLVRNLLFIGSIIYIGRSVFVDDRDHIVRAFGVLLLAAVVTVIQWVIATRAACPLCMTPVLGLKNCTKHRNSKTLLGSHRLRTSLAIIFRGAFRCPYCNEPSELAVRISRRHNSQMF